MKFKSSVRGATLSTRKLHKPRDAQGSSVHADFGKLYLDSKRLEKLGPSIVCDWDVLAARYKNIFARQRNDAVHFYRHGSTNYNEKRLVSGQHDTQLTTSGKLEALKIANSMPLKVDLIVCSALSRSIQTMRVSVPPRIRAAAQIIIDDRLNEVNLGRLQGRKRHEIPSFTAGDIDYKPEGGESYRQAAQRILSSIADILDALHLSGEAPRTALVFCHAGVIRIVETLAAPIERLSDMFRKSIDNASGIKIEADEIKVPTYWWPS